VTLLIAVAAFLAAQTPFQHAPATLVRLREERLRSRRQATVECGLLAVLGFCAAVRVVAST